MLKIKVHSSYPLATFPPPHTHRTSAPNQPLISFLLTLPIIFVPWLKLQNMIILQLQKITFISYPLEICGLAFLVSDVIKGIITTKNRCQECVVSVNVYLFLWSLKEIFHKHFWSHTIRDGHCMSLGMERKLSKIKVTQNTQYIIGGAPINLFRCH